jgi:hypothetical protein
MFLKLNFTVDKTWNHIRQIANAIINDTNINSIAALPTAAASWNATVMAGLDYTNSEIIRTVEPTTVKSHYARSSTTTALPSWTLEFQVYDAPSRKYYINFSHPSANAVAFMYVGDTILSGSMDSGQYDMTKNSSDPTTANAHGVPVFLSSTAPAQLLTSGVAINDSAPANFSNFRTFWMYLTNDCLIIASTHGASSNLGFNATYSDGSKYSGPWIFSQYQRYDYHNTDANGVIPLMFVNISRTTKGGGFGVSSDWERVDNVNGLSEACAFRVFNMIDAHPQVGTSWPLMSFPNVSWGSGNRTNEAVVLTGQSIAATNVLTTGSYGRLIHTTAQTRYPSTDLRTVGYGMLPLRWSNSYRFNRGGNATARGGFYIFNGEYFPGDTFTHGGKTYMIWPTWVGYSQRVGVAVPKE